LDLITLVNSISNAALNIDIGRKGFATRGKEQEGRILYETGIAKAMTIFQQAQTAADSQALILAEYTFLTQELELCSKSDKDSIDSITKAIQSFDDAFLALKAVENPNYKITDNAFPHNGKYRVNGFPKDAFHIAFIAHRTRIKNILRTPGLDPVRTASAFEKALLKQRLVNLATTQNSYIEKQKNAMSK